MVLPSSSSTSSLLIIISSIFINTILCQVSSEATTFSEAASLCSDGYEPMKITSANWKYAQELFDNSMAPAWIKSYNGDTYGGACLAFYGSSVNVPASCSNPPHPVLCAPISSSNATDSLTSAISTESTTTATSSFDSASNFATTTTDGSVVVVIATVVVTATSTSKWSFSESSTESSTSIQSDSVSSSTTIETNPTSTTSTLRNYLTSSIILDSDTSTSESLSVATTSSTSTSDTLVQLSTITQSSSDTVQLSTSTIMDPSTSTTN